MAKTRKQVNFFDVQISRSLESALFGHSVYYITRMSKNGAPSQKLPLRIFLILVYELQGGKY